MKSPRRLLAIAAAATLGLILTTASVQAADDKVFPGLMCQPVGGDGQPAYWNGGIVNLDTRHSLRVLCPIVRDNTTSALRKVEVVLRKIDLRLPIFSIGCQLWSATRNGGSTVHQGETVHVPDPTFTQVFVKQPEWDLGAYWLDCKVPPATGSKVENWAGVMSYFVSEP